MQPSRLLIATTAMVASILLATQVSAHGYLESPPTRALQCNTGVNTNCGPVQFDPHSLEGPKGFPEFGPADGKIAGAERFPELDEQTASRWAKVPLSSSGGLQTFEWKLTAAHRTDKWEYFITKPGWNPDAPLQRADFELVCNFNDNGEIPESRVSHQCSIPQRTGYHIVLGVWTIADTPNAFYQVIDVNFQSAEPPLTGIDATSASSGYISLYLLLLYFCFSLLV